MKRTPTQRPATRRTALSSHPRQPLRLLELTISASSGAEHVPFIRRHLMQAATRVKTHLRDLSIALVGDKTMSRLHQEFMNLPGPTDVLSFPLETDHRGCVISGEIIICVPEARRRANRHRIRLSNELLLYAIHGLLHLSGFDDRTDLEYERMHRKEDWILTELGIGSVFAASSGPTAKQKPTRRPTASLPSVRTKRASGGKS